MKKNTNINDIENVLEIIQEANNRTFSAQIVLKKILENL